MHLTPEQIDRQPFRMRRRGYDIMQVRNFLREIAQEMRERQLVREKLVRDGDPDAVGADRAQALVREAEQRAEQIVSQAEASVDVGDVPRARKHADEIVSAAEAEAERIVERAEQAARQRSDDVLAETQRRLDELLAEEREVLARIESLSDEVPDSDVDVIELPQPAAENAPVASSSLAEFMKSALRDEV